MMLAEIETPRVALQRLIDERREDYAGLSRLAYADQSLEVAGKALDFSGPTVEQRWSAGHASAMQVITRIEAGSLRIGEAGLTVIDVD